ncbi:MAG: hypothetical protein BMS9Abin37_3306 [Acidobacteriota bacterium]|nr:MAG: hypothetical protein BMS9Abin37_3306 [Acidobacteriota bacterium]
MAFLDIAREPEKADAIFVFAGREERKRLGVELFRSEYAPRLILSVGRFEWRRFEALGLWSDGGLVDMVQTIEAPERHFFVHVERDRARCEHVHKGRLGTMTEARALAAVIDEAELRSVLIVSSPEHLPRCLLALRTVVTPACKLIPVASAASNEPIARELAKLAGYGIVAIPGFLRRRRRIS